MFIAPSRLRRRTRRGPMLVVLILRMVVFLAVLAFAGLAVVHGYTAAAVAGLVIVVASAASTAGARLLSTRSTTE